MVRRGEFREDLYYRVNVIELKMPALRERGDDVLLLADHILKRLGASAASLTDEARESLRRYNFPGNVRELENLLERALTLCAGGTVDVGDLALRDDGQASSARQDAAATDLGGHIDDIQRQAILDALEKTRYNKTQAAKLLGLTFRQLRYRIKKLDIE
jgi:two-component system response regulator PilR (NtrC family)